MEKKYLVHVPIEQYGFISCELEGSADDAMEAYQELSHAKTAGETIGITQKEFNAFLDCYMNTGSPPENSITIWEEMSTEQKIIINHVKKAFARIKPKQ